MREIATLQLGSYANFVGAHFWNIQDEFAALAESDPVFSQVDMDVLYRSSDSRQAQITYTPRLLCVDLRGAASTFTSSQTATVSSWTGPVSTHVTQARKKNEFIRRLEEEEVAQTAESDDAAVVASLENEVEQWTDYLKAKLHPRSTYELEGCWAGITPFKDFGDGRGLFAESNRGEELLDRFRLIIEDCDHLQGIQTLVDDSGGFAAFAADALVEVADTYGNVPLMLFTVRPPEAEDLAPSPTRRLHDAVSLSSLLPFSDLTVPIGLPRLTGSFSQHLRITDSKPFHTSAVYAAALHTVSLPLRMLPGPEQVGSCDMGILARSLSYSGRKLAHLGACLPASMVPEIPGASNVTLKLSPLTPGVYECRGDPYAAESITVHGAKLAGSEAPASASKISEWISCGDPSLVRRHLACSPCPLPLPLPFPCIFGPSLQLESVPAAARLRTDRALLPYLQTRLHSLDKVALVLPSFGLLQQDVDELHESLSTLASAFI